MFMKTGKPPAHTSPKVPLVYVVAGEASGDLLGGRLIKALKVLYNNHVEFAGVGGESMTREGLSSLFPMQELSLMGLFEIIPHLPNLIARLSQTRDNIQLLKPDVVVTIDSPEFNFRLGKNLKKMGIPVVHYTMPSVWAWREGRAEKVSRFLSKGLALLPFEPPYFERYGLACEFVGHPIIEAPELVIKENDFRARYGIHDETPLISVLPGSRSSEVKRLLPVFAEAVKRLAQKHPNLTIVVPTLRHFRNEIEEEVMGWGVPCIVTVDSFEKFRAMHASNAALAASGTVALELALLNVPMVIGYKINSLTAAIVKRLIKIPYACLVNIILEKPVVPEYIQEACVPGSLVGALDNILSTRGQDQRQAFAVLKKLLTPEGILPSEKAASAIKALIEA
jgi:lipid-A-disaccharide synthase